MVFAASLGLMFAATLMLGGWGWAFRRVLGLEKGTWPATVALGMAAVVFIGGILNLARLAHPWALALVAAGGILLSLAALREVPLERPPLIVILLIAGIMIFTIATQLPPHVYNFRDDYQKYFAFVVRMLETGTVSGSPLSAMGVQTLGAMQFLDGFVVAFFPIVYVNGVDAVFGLFLCLILASQFTQGRRDLVAMTVVCVLSVIFIDPQYVNISTLYCGSALIMAMVAIPMESAAPSAAALGLLYAALISMKPTFAVFVAVHLLAIAFSTGIRQAIRIGLASAIFLSPWILVHSPHYLASFRTHLPPPTPVAGTPGEDHINLFSFSGLDYGAAPICYTSLIAAIGICGLICYRAARPASLKVVECCVSGVVAFLVFIYVLGPIHAGYDHSARYFTPIAIGLAAPAFGWTAYYAAQFHSRAGRIWLPLIVAIIPVASFTPSLQTRIQWAVSNHSIASYSWLAEAKDYLNYNWRVLYGPERQEVKALQERVPAGEPLLAWVNTPFYLDYQRNRIIDIDPAGLGTPWAVLPKEARYLILDYAGYATPDHEEYEDDELAIGGAGERRNAVRSLDFLIRLEALVKQGQVLYDTGEIKIVKLAAR
ncbi:MAG: hypothetical protein ABSF22_15075 [Bryobacteraceae bacterium]